MSKMSDCSVCAMRDVLPEHYKTEKHEINDCLKQFAAHQKKYLIKGVAAVSCSVQTSLGKCGNKQGKIKISAKPLEKVEFKFTLSNESQTDEIHITHIQLVHQRFNFVVETNPFSGCKTRPVGPRKFGQELKSNKLIEEIVVTFCATDIGQYECPILFYFEKAVGKDQIIIMNHMVVFVEGKKTVHGKMTSPYERKGVWAKEVIKSSCVDRSDDIFCIPKTCKHIYANDLKVSETDTDADRDLAADLSRIFDTGVTKDNYIKFFHNILWYEETIIRDNVKNYNMSAVKVVMQRNYLGTCFALEVPGLAEKRPSVLIGDLIYIKPLNQDKVIFEAVVREINENVALIGSMHQLFGNYYSADALFDVRFFISRISLERMHSAIHVVKTEGHECRIFPEENKNINPVTPIVNFFNPDVEANFEQRCAVERIVSGTSGTAPYLLHGPPGTGKTVTIVEAVLQLVLKDPENRIMVCTDSNMAADHVATMLIKYSHMFHSDNWLLRANSKFRMWESLPDCLVKYSNGTCRQNFVHVELEEFFEYSIVITTLSHAAKFARQMRRCHFVNHITHLFIDEAAQASEPACLIPVCGMLQKDGALVLAGDPHQLGPVIISREAHKIGLGTSLMERLKKDCPIYSEIRNDPNYVVMLRNNFRSNPDILEIPDNLFYKGQLRALAKEDSISNIDILGLNEHSRAIVFHGVLSKEQKMGKSPSFFNTMECDMVLRYVISLVRVHNVPIHDIGIVTPYIRQVYQIKKSLIENGFDKIEVGTVEAYQGKEKRVIIISTVRANCNLLDHDAKFNLGFLVDSKRFNVAITRAKAKCIIVGNPLCLEKDDKWHMYMQRCRELGTYHGYDSLSGDDGEHYSKEIFENLTPMMKSMKVAIENMEKEPVSEELATTPVPVDVESAD